MMSSPYLTRPDLLLPLPWAVEVEAPAADGGGGDWDMGTAAEAEEGPPDADCKLKEESITACRTNSADRY